MFSYLSSLKRIVFIALVSLGAHLYSDTNETAFISVPVADLTVEPYYKFSKKGFTIDDYYNKIPFSGSWQACKRAHQLLFNERVTVLEEKGAEVKIQISNFYFLNANGSVPSDTYWTLKKNLTYIKDLKIKKSDSYKIPYSISYKENNITSKTTEATITLKKPFYDPITKEIYSVGTRFTLASDLDHKGPHGKGHFEAYIYDTQVKKIKILQVPRLNCVRNYSKKPEDKIQNFVQVLRLWAYQKDGAIPYVLGGWSWTITCDSDDFEVHKESGSEHSYHRKKWPHDSKIGFDCMGIIGRAAQICELPFYIKNTTTLLKDLKPLKEARKFLKEIFFCIQDMLWSSPRLKKE